MAASVKVDVYSGSIGNTRPGPMVMRNYDWLVAYGLTASGQTISGGSGTHIGNGVVITNRHVGELVGREAKVLFPSGREYRGRVVAVCKFSDLAAISVPEAADQPSIEIALTPPATGSTVYQAGYPASNQRRLHQKTGTMNTSAQVQWGVSNQIRMHCSSGDSGSGIFNEAGQLVGVLWGGDGESTMACTCADTNRFIREECVTWWPGKLIGRPDPNAPKKPVVPGEGKPLTPQPPVVVVPPPYQPPVGQDYAAVLAAIDALGKSVAAIQLKPGPPGKDGANGRNGLDGKDGLPGSPGLSGADGKQGADGKIGPPGIPGPTGPTGPNGKDQSADIAALMQRVADLEAQLKTRVRIVPAQP